MDKEDCMRIKSFKLGGHTIKVKYIKTVRDANDGSEIMGQCNPMTNELLIATHLNGTALAEDVIKHSLARS